MAYNDLRYLGAASGYTAAQSAYSPMGIGEGAYDTPGYGEGYRPLYGESTYDPYNPWYQGRGAGHYIWNASNAFAPGLGMGSDLPYYQNASMHTQYAGGAIINPLPDAAMNFAQQYALPFGAYYAGYKIHQAAKFKARGAIGGVMTGVTGHQAPRVHLGTAIGERLGMGAGRAIGAPIGYASQGLLGIGSAGSVARGVGLAGSLVGGAIGAAATPALIGIGISSALNAAIFQPYVDTRRISQAIQTNLSNRIITGSNAAPNNMLGMSATAATSIASGISNSAWEDFGFSNAQYSSLVDYGMQAGLYSDLGSGSMSTRNMVERTKKLALDVKKVMEVFGEKDMREAVGLLSQFAKQGGITGSYETTSALGSLRLGTLMTGKSAREIYDVVGAAGSMAAQSGGMSGIAGVMTATSTYAGMANAQRMGLVSGRMLSLLGGLEGATGLATNAKVALGMSDYNRIALYSQFYGGGTSSNIMDNISRFSNLIGKDPLTAYGNMALHGQEMRDAQLRANPLSAYLPMMQMLQTMYPGKSSFTEGQLAGVMKGLGMDDASIKAALLEIANAKRGYGRDVLTKSQADAYRQHLEGGGWSYFGALGREARYATYSAGQALGHIGEFPKEVMSRAEDWVSASIDRLRFGALNTGSTFLDAYGGDGKAYDIYDIDSMRGLNANIARRINEAASGSAGADARDAARRFLANGGTGADVTRIYKMLGEDISSTAAYDFANGSTGIRKETHIPNSRRVRDDDAQMSQLSLLSGENRAGLGAYRPGSRGRGRKGQFVRDPDNRTSRLKSSSPEARNAYYAMIAAVVQGKSPAEIAQLLNDQPDAVRAEALKLLDPAIMHGMDFKGGSEWLTGLQGGKISASELQSRLSRVYGVREIDELIKNPDMIQDLSTRLATDKDGRLKIASSEEQDSLMRSFGVNISGNFSRGAMLQAKYIEQLSGVKSAEAQGKPFEKLMTDKVTSMDGSGDTSSKTMASAANMFSQAVAVFAGVATNKAPNDVLTQMNSLRTNNKTLPEGGEPQ